MVVPRDGALNRCDNISEAYFDPRVGGDELPKPPPPRQQLLHQPALELALGCDDGPQRVNDVLDPIEIECGLRTSLSALEHRYHNLSERGKMPTVTEVWNSAPGEDRKPVQVSGADTLI